MAGRLDSSPDLTHKVRARGVGVAFSHMCAHDGCKVRSSSLSGWGAVVGPFGRIRICPEHKQARDERIAARKAAKIAAGGAQ